MRLDQDIIILGYQLRMMNELMKLWNCDKQYFIEVEKRCNLFSWIRKNYEYLQHYGDESAAEDIDRYINGECAKNDK